MSRAGLLLVVLVAWALRLHGLNDVPLRWDEGWSIALARLPWHEVLRLTALDVHPPLYYLALAPWLDLARSSELWLRLPSAAAGTIAVPLAAFAACRWWPSKGAGRRRLGLAAAAAVAAAPALVYYAGVTRMYALTTPLLLLAVGALATYASGGRRLWSVAATVGAAGALYTFYYTGFALAGLFAAALLVWPRAWRRIGAVGAAAALAYGPWIAFAAPRMLERTGVRTGGAGFRLDAVPGLLDDGLIAALFAHDAGWPALVGVLVVVVAGWSVARPIAIRRLGIVVLPVLATLVGAALGAQAHMFAARYCVGATPFLALGAGWALAALADRGRPLALAGALVLVAAVAPTYAQAVFTRAAEVTEAFDPAGDVAALAGHARSDEVVAFNILSLAGTYERHRTLESPDWTYAQVWDPVREAPEIGVARVRDASTGRRRLWLVLYRGTASPGSAALKAWADETLYPGEGWWTEDRLYQSYVTAAPDRTWPAGPTVDGAPADATLDATTHDRPPGGPTDVGATADVTTRDRPSPAGARLDGVADLVSARYTGTTSPGGGVAVDLTWRATATPTSDARVFVHIYDAAGNLVAQHDAFPATDTRPPTTWRPGETIADRHGLVLPPGSKGRFTLKVGLYDPATGRRWTTADGADSVTLGAVEAG